MELAGRVAIVTGGAVRLGRAIALALADEGCHVVLHYGNSATEAARTAQDVAERGVRTVTVQADFRRPTEAAEFVFDRAAAEFSNIDILVNNAAVFEEGTLESTGDDQWERHFAINLKAPFFLSREFARRRRAGKAGQGHIVNIADWRATRPVVGHLTYTLTKSGLVTMTRILARELAPETQVNAIAPGAILPPPNAGPEYLNELANRNPLRRIGKTGDVTRALLFLLRSEFITGEIVHVTGGEHL